MNAEKLAAEPLPCPFCGHVGLDFGDGSTHRWGLASCGACGATCGEVRRNYPDDGKWHADAIKEWNRRSQDAQAEPLTEEQITSIWKKWPHQAITSAARAISFTREVERAHGIGEKP